MAKKSKAFSELLRLQKSSHQHQDSLARFQNKLKKELFEVEKIVVSPPGQVKMSEVLEDFVEPYWKKAKTEDAQKKLLILAIYAWNIALFPKPEQPGMIDEILTDSLVEGNQKMKADIEYVIEHLIARKNRYFSEYERMIIDFEFKDEGSGYHLFVASTAIPKSSELDLE